MLDDFIEEQNIATKILKNAVKKNKISHAYLFETNKYDKKDIFVLSFIKYLLCPNKYSNKKKCINCNQCEKIDKASFSEIKHIYPDGMWIKKEQLIELQKDFSEKSVESNKRIYVIHEAEKLNTAAANSILKFLEEPEDNIIAILVTDNIYQLLETIISRCQIISLKNNNNIKNINLEEKINYYIDMNTEISKLESEEKLEKIKKTIEFIYYYESNKLDTVLYTQNKFHPFFQTQKEVILFFDIANLFYLEVLKYKTTKKIKVFNDYEKIINSVSKKNTKKDLINKINIILKCKEAIKYNANINLLIDKMIIEMEEGI